MVYTSKKPYIADTLSIAGTIIFASFIVALWIGQQRPPMRTMGETRLWSSFLTLNFESTPKRKKTQSTPRKRNERK